MNIEAALKKTHGAGWWETHIEHFAEKHIDGWRVMRRVIDNGVALTFPADEGAYTEETKARNIAQDMQDAWVAFVDTFGPWRNSFAA
jgi:hypothetical protein